MSDTPPFILFGLAHLSALFVIGTLSILIARFSRDGLSAASQYRFGVALAVLLIAQEILHLWYQTNYQDRLLTSVLPLHLCGLSVLLTVWTLIARTYLTYEILYFWAWGGTLQALLTPDLEQGFPDPAFLTFFLGHGLVIVGVLYATLVYRFRPHVISIFKSLGALAITAALIAPINLWLGSNYLFLSQKPEQTSLMDVLGPWPWYLVSLTALAFVSSVLWYLPFYIKDRRAMAHAAESAMARPRRRA
ncbi:TIGR02206 family membrane protein [Thiocapsa imhoffii]|uniref:TIGR02206 family membrane protein n=1 Tax=Thiocapsa imhoffii TaxID=382777 RepID=A0A9X1B9C0_9GAMM|nr:TIGR02206 family membrane protein [Thiocapsa imhoffii]MBK1644886.1 TIGR02206 family membrane protein [Thiocapsa imhoffii]